MKTPVIRLFATWSKVRLAPEQLPEIGVVGLGG